MPGPTLTARSVRIAEGEARWLSAAAIEGGVSQNDLLRLGLHRLRQELGAASRIKPETIAYKLASPRTRAGQPAATQKTRATTPTAETASASAVRRPAGSRDARAE